MFGDKVNSDAVSYAASVYPQEACGLVFKGSFIPCVNEHTEPAFHFKIALKTQIKYKGFSAVLHSHPSGPKHPSLHDFKNQIASGVPWGIIYQNRVVWFGDQVPMAPLVGREFIYGVYDCRTLVRDWYQLSMGLVLRQTPSEYGWWKGSGAEGQLAIQELLSQGFYVVPTADYSDQVGDIWVGNFTADFLSHAAVISNPGMIMQHLFQQRSNQEPLARWRKYFTLRLRLKA